MTLVKFYPRNGQMSKRNNELLSYSDLWNDFFNENHYAPVMNTPRANITESNESFRIELALPGIEKKEIKIDVNKDVLSVSREYSETTKNTSFRSREFNYGSFDRSFRLPESVDTDKISASMNNGILEVFLPKKTEAIDRGPKEIKIS